MESIIHFGDPLPLPPERDLLPHLSIPSALIESSSAIIASCCIQLEQRARFHLETNGRRSRPTEGQTAAFSHHRIIGRRQPAHGRGRRTAAHLDEDEDDRGRSEVEAGNREKTDGWKDRRTNRRTAANAEAAKAATTTEGILWCHIIIRGKEETKGLRLRSKEEGEGQ